MHPASALTVSAIGLSRRNFLRSAVGALSATTVRGFAAGSTIGVGAGSRAKTIVVTFGGGARDEETFALEGQRNIPHLLNDLVPQGTFFTQVVNRGILGHYVATTSIVTGVYERFDNFVAQPPPHATLFEYFRKGLGRPERDAWVIAPSNGFQRIGTSTDALFGPQYGANVVMPKELLGAALAARGGDRDAVAHLLQDNFEHPGLQPLLSPYDHELRLETLTSTLRLSVADFVAHAKTLDSADELSLFIARHLMQQVAPSLMTLTLHDMDIAHTGAYSLYVDAIQRADRLCGELWAAVQSSPEYKDRTTLLILPDFGRDGDDEPAGNGFQHHRTGGALARTTWLLALGPGIRENVTVDRAIESIDVVPTLGCRLGFSTPGAHGRCIAELV